MRALRQAYEFFENKLSSIDSIAEEVSFCNGKIEESLYNFKWELPEDYIEALSVIMTNAFEDIPLEAVEGFSYQAKDGQVYSEDKFMLMLNTARGDCFLYPELNCFDPWPDYCLNLSLQSGRRHAKFYDTSRGVVYPFDLPPGVHPEPHYGTGIGQNQAVRGVYVKADDYHEFVKWSGLPAPIPKELETEVLAANKFNLFGIAYDKYTNALLKIVYYHYPRRAVETPDDFL